MSISTRPKVETSDGLLERILGRNCPVREPGIGLPHRDHVWDPIAILGFVVRINCTPPCSNHRAGRWGSLVAICTQPNFLGKNEILDRCSVVQDLLPGRTTVLPDLAEVLGPEEDSSAYVSIDARFVTV